jgi:hypothetical protein
VAIVRFFHCFTFSLAPYGVATMAIELAAVVDTICESSWPAVVVSKV